ncbi:hypothetical protein Mpt1_c04320 [Candidatus Methanoplasma termitum]|uniref:GPR1/FUN34/yaaH family protein n=1 Tax=Candidatus Methanoplasma termitum TaxID=1577791 RepID=A0A0A7LFP8_9ARCH|nr:hypothetical protein [Candidatus Methanoplasma termitum]AIZ56326.1 hypothetical protein Mpt1_c04320 [Candidatus Methanoplasma termitum]
MVECQKCLDPTSLGLFLVAVVSFALAFWQLVGQDGAYGLPSGVFFQLIGLFAIAVAYFAYKAEANFGFVVFGLVGAAVALTGFGMGAFENIAFAITFAIAIVWSIFVKTPKFLSLILVTTTLIFLFVGIALYIDPNGANFIGANTDYWHWLIGLAALFNFIFSVYLAFAIATEKAPAV